MPWFTYGEARNLSTHTYDEAKVISVFEIAFSESDLSIKVDVHDWNALSDSFKRSIGSRYEVI